MALRFHVESEFYMARPVLLRIAALLGVCIVGTTCGFAETLEIAIPIENRVNQLTIDLGAPVDGAVTVHFSAAGTATAALMAEGEYGSPDLCSNPETFPQEMLLRISSDSAEGIASAWTLVDNGAFAIADTLMLAMAFADGHANVELEFGRRLFDFLQVCYGAHHACQECQAGLLEFDRPPLLRIQYSPLVGAESASWGRTKAVYR